MVGTAQGRLLPTLLLISGKWATGGDSPAAKDARREQERLGPDYLAIVFGGGAPSIPISARDAQVEHVALTR
jgi:hypothetical protein